MGEVTGSAAQADPLFILGCQGFPADLFRFVIIFLWRFWVCLHVSAVEAEKREKGNCEIHLVNTRYTSTGRVFINRFISRHAEGGYEHCMGIFVSSGHKLGLHMCALSLSLSLSLPYSLHHAMKPNSGPVSWNRTLSGLRKRDPGLGKTWGSAWPLQTEAPQAVSVGADGDQTELSWKDTVSPSCKVSSVPAREPRGWVTRQRAMGSEPARAAHPWWMALGWRPPINATLISTAD